MMSHDFIVDTGKNEMDKYLNKKQIIDYLSDHMGEFSTYQDIADVTGLTRTTVSGLIMELLKGGYIGRRKGTNVYWGFAYKIYSNELKAPNEQTPTNVRKETHTMAKHSKKVRKNSLASEVIKYIKAHPNCTAVEMSNALTHDIKSVAAVLTTITSRKLVYRQKVGKSFQYNTKKSGLQGEVAVQQPMIFATKKITEKKNKVTFAFVDSNGNTVINFSGDTTNQEHIGILKNIIAGLEK